MAAVRAIEDAAEEEVVVVDEEDRDRARAEATDDAAEETEEAGVGMTAGDWSSWRNVGMKADLLVWHICWLIGCYARLVLFIMWQARRETPSRQSDEGCDVACTKRLRLESDYQCLYRY